MEHLVRHRSEGNLETPPRNDPSSMGNRSSQRTESVPKYRTVNINSASAKHLQVLNGIGEVYAKRIIDGRPYRRVSDLASRRIIPTYIFARVSAEFDVG
jgi:DNA uptake protein ComE-like DNA-binding protein